MKLSPCKCGGEAYITGPWSKGYGVYCLVAGCPASTAWYPTQAEAAAAWERLQTPIYRVPIPRSDAPSGGKILGDEEEQIMLSVTSDMIGGSLAIQALDRLHANGFRIVRTALSSRPADGAQERVAELEAEITKLKRIVLDGRSAVSKPPTRDKYLIEQRELRIAAWADVARAALSAASAGRGE